MVRLSILPATVEIVPAPRSAQWEALVRRLIALTPPVDATPPPPANSAHHNAEED